MQNLKAGTVLPLEEMKATAGNRKRYNTYSEVSVGAFSSMLIIQCSEVTNLLMDNRC